mmetsp:Transcript_88439/g.250684  ORF Transcript_88439/g.250684 Transcript_88439/m.250684 type:complete len:210 (-) Transcript_88439:30-659(-)
MLPMAMGPPRLPGPLTPEMQAKLHKLRYCVVGIFVAAVGRLATGDIPFNELLCGINGVFLLRDDPGLATCYACLSSGPLGHFAGPGGGGLGCLMPFIFVASFNCLFLALRLFYGGPFLLASFCSQAAGALLAWRLNALVTLAAAEGLGTGPDQGQPLTTPLTQMQMFAGGGQEAGRPGPTAGRGQGPRGPGFVAFQGTGQRLCETPAEG